MFPDGSAKDLNHPLFFDDCRKDKLLQSIPKLNKRLHIICSISLPKKITWFCVFIQRPFRMPTIDHFWAMIFVWWFFYRVNHWSRIDFATKGIHIGTRSSRPITARCTCRKIRTRIRIMETSWFILSPLIIIFSTALQLKWLSIFSIKKIKRQLFLK